MFLHSCSSNIAFDWTNYMLAVVVKCAVGLDDAQFLPPFRRSDIEFSNSSGAIHSDFNSTVALIKSS